MSYISEAKQLLQKYSSYCIFDIETTDCSSPKLLQIYAETFDSSWNRTGEFYCVCKPDTALSPSTILKTGITDALLNKQGKSFSNLLSEFNHFSKNSFLIAYECNSRKLPLLLSYYRNQGSRLEVRDSIDVKLVFKELFPESKSCEFLDICEQANVKYERGVEYRAIYESKLLKEIMLYLEPLIYKS